MCKENCRFVTIVSYVNWIRYNALFYHKYSGSQETIRRQYFVLFHLITIFVLLNYSPEDLVIMKPFVIIFTLPKHEELECRLLCI